MRILLSFTISLILSIQLAGQDAPKKNVTNQQLVWFAYYNKLEISPKWHLVSEVEERRFRNPDARHQFVLRSHIHYQFAKDWDVSAGFTYFLQSPNDPESKSNLVVPELRPHIQVDGATTLSPRWRLDHRYRLESRFFRKFENDELTDGFVQWYRARYRIGISYKLMDVGSGALNLKLSNEIHINFGEEIIYNRFDQNRIYFGANIDLSRYFVFEAGFLKWFQQRPTGVDFYNRDIIRFLIVHKIKLKQKKVQNES